MRSIILEYPGVLLITLLSLQCIWSLKAPLLECFTNGLRLYFQPDEPFSGHIYVKGSFMQKKCHLDYTQNPLSVPSYFPISYKNGCNMKCEEQNEPPGVNYRLLLVVQNHRLFVTKDDVIYSINCFYRKGFDSLTQDVEIRNGLTTVKLSGESTFKCSYQLLDSLNGNLVSYANVGDNLYHKWRCASDTELPTKYGMLVHSCYARENDDVIFQLVDDRGCVVDNTLMQPLIYSNNLTLAYTVIPAFKFVNQPIVRFQCKVTLCIKEQNNCERITPPVCKRSPKMVFQQEIGDVEAAAVTTESTLSSNTKLLCQTTDNGVEQQCQTTSEDAADYTTNIVTGGTTESNISVASNRVNNETGNYKQKRSVNESRLPMNSRKFPTVANPADANHLILDVDADQLIIFEQNEMNQTSSTEMAGHSCLYEFITDEMEATLLSFHMFQQHVFYYDS
ncbi:Cuticlin-6 [Dirofilaria immitis]